MGFTVQRLASFDPATNNAQWAVVLDHEHVMFVGDYQQCEAWLDHHELTQVPDNAPPQGRRDQKQRLSDRIMSMMRVVLAKCQGRTVQPTDPSTHDKRDSHNRVVRAMSTFLTGSAGHCGTVEILMAAFLMAVLYLGTMLASMTIAWDRALLIGAMTRMPSTTRPSLQASTARPSTCHGESAEIACDLALSNRP